MFYQKSVVTLLYTSTALAYPSLHLTRAGSRFYARDTPAFGTCSKVTNDGILSVWAFTSSSDGLPAPANPEAQYTCIASGKKDDYPAKSQWISFDAMWEVNEPIMQKAGSTEEQVGWIRDAITEVGESTAVDPRLILAVVMQESTGNVNAPCDSDVSGDHCGLMQAPHGSKAFDASQGQASIKSMIQDGVCGIEDPRAENNGIGRPGLLQYYNGGSLMSWITSTLFGNPYTAARLYNSGEAKEDDLNASPWGTKAYTNDIVNRLQGWNGGNEGCLKSVECGLRDAGACS